MVSAAGWVVHKAEGIGEVGRLLARLRPNRFFSALPYEYAHMDFSVTEFIGTIHGLRPVEMPADRYAARYAQTTYEWLKCWIRFFGRHAYAAIKAAEFAALVSVRARRRTFIVPSEFTRSSVLAHCQDANSSEITVLYSPRTSLAANPRAKAFSPTRWGLERRRYVLIVSADRWVKNTYRALYAIERLYRRLPETHRWPVAVVGQFPIRFPARWNRMFRFIGRCETDVLAGLFASAGALLYPTLNEGFGYPPVEAMSYGTPVIASAISAVPEIARDGAVYFSPHETFDIEARLGWLLTDESARLELSAAALKRYTEIERRQEADLEKLCRFLIQ